MPALFQCAPNFSEGRDADILDALRAAAGPCLRDLSSDPDHNRAVATLLGAAEEIAEAAFRLAAVAVERIDLRLHAGQHPFVGALDVLPFVPFHAATMADADTLARRVAARIGADLGVPVYLYAESAPGRALPDLRRGGLDALRDRMESMPPDFGPPGPHPSAGVTVAGARGPLLAFNVNLATDDVPLARHIARSIRGSEGGIPGVRALGLWLATPGCAQVSVNITDPTAATLQTVLASVRRLAADAGVSVRNTELVGGIALPFLLAALNEALGSDILPRQVLMAESDDAER